MNTDRPTSYQFQVNGSTVSGSLTWNPNGNMGSLAINNPFNSADTQTCNYTHDDLQRTASVSCSGANAWTQTFAYDAFGNISKDGTQKFLAGYSSSTNRISVGIPNAYDTNGNLTSINSDYLHSYSWDADGNQVYVDGIQVTFDALDRAVEQLSSGSYKQILYTTSGNKLALVSGGALLEGFVPLPGNAAAVYKSGSLTYYRHPDWLGSSRLASTTTRAMYSSGSYAPFGESYSEVGTTDRSFTGQNQDTESGQYDFLYRNYSSVQGRWISPDPAGIASAQAGNPQSWNRYAYVINRPLKNVDAMGLECSEDGTCINDMDNSGGGGTEIYIPVGGSNGLGVDYSYINVSSGDGVPDFDLSQSPSMDYVTFTLTSPVGRQSGGSGGSSSPNNGTQQPSQTSERLTRLKNCALAYYGIDPLSATGLASDASKWLLAGGPGVPKAAAEAAGIRVIRTAGDSSFTSLARIGSILSGGAIQPVAVFAKRFGGPIAIASAVIDATAIGICTAMD